MFMNILQTVLILRQLSHMGLYY